MKVNGKVENFHIHLNDIEVRVDMVELIDNGGGSSLSWETLMRPVREKEEPSVVIKKSAAEGGERSGKLIISNFFVKKGLETIAIGHLELEMSADDFEILSDLLDE